MPGFKSNVLLDDRRFRILWLIEKVVKVLAERRGLTCVGWLVYKWLLARSVTDGVHAQVSWLLHLKLIEVVFIDRAKNS